MSEKALILPVPDIDSKEYWDGCNRGELLIRRCKSCGEFRFPPGPGCPHCGSLDSEWVRIKGEGELYSFIVVPFASHPALDDRVPYNVAAVSLPEAGNVRIIANIVDCRNEDLYIGMRLELLFTQITDGVVLPNFRPASPKA